MRIFWKYPPIRPDWRISKYFDNYSGVYPENYSGEHSENYSGKLWSESGTTLPRSLRRAVVNERAARAPRSLRREVNESPSVGHLSGSSAEHPYFKKALIGRKIFLSS